MKIMARNQIEYGGPNSADVPDTKTPNEISAMGPLGIGVGELQKKLGIGGTKDSFATGRSITDGTSRLIQQGIILQKDKDVAFADGSVKVSNDLQNDLQNIKKGELK